MKISFVFNLHDWWVGFFWSKKYRTLYFLPIPCVGVKVRFPERRDVRGRFDADSNPSN